MPANKKHRVVAVKMSTLDAALAFFSETNTKDPMKILHDGEAYDEPVREIVDGICDAISADTSTAVRC